MRVIPIMSSKRADALWKQDVRFIDTKLASVLRVGKNSEPSLNREVKNIHTRLDQMLARPEYADRMEEVSSFVDSKRSEISDVESECRAALVEKAITKKLATANRNLDSAVRFASTSKNAAMVQRKFDGIRKEIDTLRAQPEQWQSHPSVVEFYAKAEASIAAAGAGSGGASPSAAAATTTGPTPTRTAAPRSSPSPSPAEKKASAADARAAAAQAREAAKALRAFETKWKQDTKFVEGKLSQAVKPGRRMNLAEKDIDAAKQRLEMMKTRPEYSDQVDKVRAYVDGQAKAAEDALLVAAKANVQADVDALIKSLTMGMDKADKKKDTMPHALLEDYEKMSKRVKEAKEKESFMGNSTWVAFVGAFEEKEKAAKAHYKAAFFQKEAANQIAPIAKAMKEVEELMYKRQFREILAIIPKMFDAVGTFATQGDYTSLEVCQTFVSEFRDWSQRMAENYDKHMVTHVAELKLMGMNVDAMTGGEKMPEAVAIVKEATEKLDKRIKAAQAGDVAVECDSEIVRICGGLLKADGRGATPLLTIVSLSAGDLSPELYPYIKKYNEKAAVVNKLVRHTVQFMQEAPLDDMNFTTVEYNVYRTKEFADVVTYCRPVGEAIAEMSSKVRGEALPVELEDGLKSFHRDWDELKSHWRTIISLADAKRAVRDELTLLRNTLSVLDEYDDVDCTLSTLLCPKIISIGPERSRKSPLLNENRQRIKNTLGTNKELDTDVCPLVVTLAERLYQKTLPGHVSTWGDFPLKSKFEDEARKVRLAAIKRHPRHCLIHIAKNGGNVEAKDHFAQALKRYPLARAKAPAIVAAVYEREFEGKPPKNAKEEREHAAWKHWVDPFQGVDVPDAYSSIEVERWYVPYDAIKPGPQSVTGLPYAQRDDQSTSAVWTPYRERHAGHIVFSGSRMGPGFSDEAAHQDAFTLGDEIYARAHWERSIANFPKGRDDDGNLVYGPERSRSTTQLVLFISVDGVPIVLQGNTQGYLALLTDVGTPAKAKADLGTTDDFYAWNQTCQIHVSGHSLRELRHTWDQAGQRVTNAVVAAGEGSHRVKVELCYRLRGNPADLSTLDTPTSHPIASGEFTITVPPGGASNTHVILPRRSRAVSIPTAHELEDYLSSALRSSAEWGSRPSKTEELISLTLQTNYFVSKRTARGETLAHGVTFSAAFYRSPETGWSREEVAIFTLSAYTPEKLGQVEAIPPMQPRFGVGPYFTIDADLLSDTSMALIEKRCPPKLRYGAF